MSESACSTGPQPKSHPAYYKMRYVFFVFISIVSLGIPFIRIDGNHLFLLSFDHKQLHLAGIVFDMQEFYLMPFLLMFLFLFIFGITTLGGRVWCGWSCPQTIFRVIYRDWIKGSLLGMNKRKNKQKEGKMSDGERRIKNAIAFMIWVVLSFVAASNFMWYFVPPEDFFVYIQNPADHSILVGTVLIIAGFLIYDIIKLKEDFCIYVCPYVRIQSALYDRDTIMTIYDENRGGKIYDEEGNKLWKKPPGEKDECTGCEACVSVCPTHIDIRKAHMQLECINCLECADACTTVMGKLGKPSLIEWESLASMATGKTSFLRFRTMAYGVLLTGIVIALFMMGSTKETMLLNINKSNRIYAVKEGNVVTNDYVFLFTNTDSKDHKFFFEVVGRDDIEITRPNRPFTVRSGGKVKKIVVLKAKGQIGTDADRTSKLPIKIRSYAIDAKDQIFAVRDSVFMYPPLNEIK